MVQRHLGHDGPGLGQQFTTPQAEHPQRTRFISENFKIWLSHRLLAYRENSCLVE
ncbi:MAG: hypothetical protein GY917_22275 [Planctomycetaceae bacterium]|nr:hypothetical protein [Planctomycetaceae bacterium]